MKKIISIILTICICLSLLSGISFAGAEDTATWNADGVYTYSFVAGTGDCQGISSNTNLWEMEQNYDKSSFHYFDADDILKGYFDAYSEWDKTDTTAVYKCSYENEYYSVNINDSATRLLRFATSYFRFKLGAQKSGDGFPKDRWVALKLDASKLPKGTYDITFNTDSDYIRDCSIYLAPYGNSITNTEDYMTADNLLFTQSGNATEKKVEDWKLSSDETDYVMIIKLNAVSEVRLTSITFERQVDYVTTHSKDIPITYNLTTGAFKSDLYDELAATYTDSTVTVQNINLNKFSSYLNWNSMYGDSLFMDTSATAPWRVDYVGSSAVTMGSDRILDTSMRVTFTNYEDDAFVVVRTYVPNSGTFDISVSAKKINPSDSPGSADVYYIKSKGSAYTSSDVSGFKSSGTNIGAVSSIDGMGCEIEGVSLDAGEYAFLFVPTAEKKGRTHIASITLIPTDDAGYTEAFKASDSVDTTYAPNVVAYAYAKDNTDIGVTASAKDDDADGVWTLEAPEKVGDYNFLYWAKGLTTSDNRLVVSTSATYNEYVPQNNANYVIAVYDKAGEASKAEFYNANGQLIETLKENGNAPTLPYMAGYGQASNWALHGTSTKINGGDPVTLSGNMIFFAQYDITTPDTFEITVNGKSKTYNYGQLVECKADATDTDGNIFYGWTKTVNGGDAQLVSAEQTYTFRAWESCTVTPVYKKTTGIIFDGAKRKILLGTFDLGGEEAVMAEYIGFENADEKGIILGTQEIAMTSDNNQFTVVNNDEVTSISGYAILGGKKYIFNK